MTHRLFILMFSLIASLPAVGCRPLMLSPAEKQTIQEPDTLKPRKKQSLPVDERPTGTSDRAREIERSLGLGR